MTGPFLQHHSFSHCSWLSIHQPEYSDWHIGETWVKHWNYESLSIHISITSDVVVCLPRVCWILCGKLKKINLKMGIAHTFKCWNQHTYAKAIQHFLINSFNTVVLVMSDNDLSIYRIKARSSVFLHADVPPPNSSRLLVDLLFTTKTWFMSIFCYQSLSCMCFADDTTFSIWLTKFGDIWPRFQWYLEQAYLSLIPELTGHLLEDTRVLFVLESLQGKQ